MVFLSTDIFACGPAFCGLALVRDNGIGYIFGIVVVVFVTVAVFVFLCVFLVCGICSQCNLLSGGEKGDLEERVYVSQGLLFLFRQSWQDILLLGFYFLVLGQLELELVLILNIHLNCVDFVIGSQSSITIFLSICINQYFVSINYIYNPPFFVLLLGILLSLSGIFIITISNKTSLILILITFSLFHIYASYIFSFF